jgi:hypothetical protein
MSYFKKPDDTYFIEKIFLSLPGGNRPVYRFAYGAVAGSALAFAIKPAVAFNKDGTARQWYILNKSNPTSTLFPWWYFPLALSVSLSLFV